MSAFDLKLIFSRMRERYVLTVFTLRKSSLAISETLCPPASLQKIWNSRSERLRVRRLVGRRARQALGELVGDARAHVAPALGSGDDRRDAGSPAARPSRRSPTRPP